MPYAESQTTQLTNSLTLNLSLCPCRFTANTIGIWSLDLPWCLDVDAWNFGGGELKHMQLFGFKITRSEQPTARKEFSPAAAAWLSGNDHDPIRTRLDNPFRVAWLY